MNRSFVASNDNYASLTPDATTIGYPVISNYGASSSRSSATASSSPGPASNDASNSNNSAAMTLSSANPETSVTRNQDAPNNSVKFCPATIHWNSNCMVGMANLERERSNTGDVMRAEKVGETPAASTKGSTQGRAKGPPLSTKNTETDDPFRPASLLDSGSQLSFFANTACTMADVDADSIGDEDLGDSLVPWYLLRERKNAAAADEPNE